MKKSIFLLFILSFLFKNISAQYEAECFVKTKELINKEITTMPTDSMHIQDTIMGPDMVKRYLDTVVRIYNSDKANAKVSKIVGCRMPDFSYTDLAGETYSINSIKTDFTIVNFSFIDCGDVCNVGLHCFSKLKSKLKDSITVINIYRDPTDKVREFVKDFEDNIEFVGNADILSYNYSIEYGSSIYYVLDKYKNIVYVKSGFHYVNSPNEIYFDLLEKMRVTACPD